MKKGFTLLELVVVIVILGVLATLGFTQYGRMVERARGAEAKAILGSIRMLSVGYRLQNSSVTGMVASDVNVGTATDQIPSSCASTHYFSYGIGTPADPSVTITATRCTTGGKAPQGVAANTLILTSNVTTGSDTWGGTGGY